MSFFRPRRSSPRWAPLRLGLAALLSAALMSAVSGHFEAQVDQAQSEQIYASQAREAFGTLLNDLDSLLLGEEVEELHEDKKKLDETMRRVEAFDSPRQVTVLKAQYARFLRAADHQESVVRVGDQKVARWIDKNETDPAYDRVQMELADLDLICRERARTGTIAKYSASFLALLVCAGLVTYFAARYRNKASDLASLEVQRHSVEASERRLRFHYDMIEATRGLTDPKAMIDAMVAFLAQYLGVEHGSFLTISPGIGYLGPVDLALASRDAEVWAASFAGSNALMDPAEPCVVNDLRAEIALRVDEPIPFSIGAYVYSPIVRDGTPRAALIFASGAPREWSTEELSLIEEVGARCFLRFQQAEAEAATRRSEEHIRFFFDALDSGVWEWEIGSGKVAWSQGLFTMLGLDPSATCPSVEAMRAHVLSEDEATFESLLSSAGEEGLSTRLRLRDAAGKVLTVLAQSRTQFDAVGRPLRLIGTITDVTRIFEAEEAQREVEHRSQWTQTLLEAHVRSSLDGILIVDPQGKIVLQNRRMCDIWGIPEELIESTDDARQVAFVMDAVKDPESFVATIKELYANPFETKHDEIELRNGKIIDRHTGPAVGPDGSVYGRIWTFRDVTHRVRAEQAIRESEAQLHLLMESMPQIVWRAVPGGSIVFFNDRWAEYTGQSLDESLGHGWREIVHPEDRTTGLLTEEPNAFEIEHRLLGANGIYRWFLIRGIPMVGDDGRAVQWFGTCTDIDDLKLSEGLLREAQEELESRVEQRTRDLAVATREAERANAAKSEFLSRMSHELRTPLNAILGFGQILQRQVAGESQKESVDYILKGGRHLLGLINEILDLSRVEAGRADLSIEPVPVAELLDESFAMIRNASAERGIALEENLSLFENVYVSADRQRLKQVLINLLSNAVKYNRPDGRISARMSDDGETLRLGIEDTGYGISKENLDKLFTPFERLNAGLEVEGTGLGLFLTQKLVAAMGGRLKVESELGTGTTFTVEFARVQAPTEAFLALEHLPAPTAGALTADSDHPCSILSIEDNSANTRLMEMIVAARPDVVLTTATHGFEGLTLARQSEPDLILLDLNLPDISGLDVLKRLRRSVTTAQIPVLVLSADASEAKIDAVLAAGADAFLTKPLDIERFIRTLDQHLARSAAQGATPLEVAA